MSQVINRSTWECGYLRELDLDRFIINDDSDCYVIAEIGHNHGGDVNVAMDMIKAAQSCGANAVKFQKRDNKNLYTSEAYYASYANENSYGATYGQHREVLEFGWSEYHDLKQFSQMLGITMFATAFDMRSIAFLANLDMPFFKVASGDLRNIPLLKHMAQFGKPILLSTGGGTLEDVSRAVDAIMPINAQLALLQCTAAYPPQPEQMNLRVIETYREYFPTNVVGLSSHDNGIVMPVAAYILGARIVEKHFTLNHTMKGTDHAFSLEPPGFAKMVRDLRRVRVALGDGIKVSYDSESKPISKMGKSLYAGRPLKCGEILTCSNVAIKSPAGGMDPYMLDSVLGMEVTRDVGFEEPIYFDFLREHDNG